MKTLQVRNLPDETHAVLRRRAAEAGMSLHTAASHLRAEREER